MPTYGQLKESILGYMNRSQDTFVINLEDNLLRAVNMAKDYCQRSVDLEYAREYAQVQTTLINGGDLTTATLFGTTTPVVIKSIERVFVGGTSLSTQIPIPLISREAYTRRLERRLEAVNARPASLDADIQSAYSTWPLSLVQYGRRVCLIPADSQTAGSENPVVYFDILKWLPDFALVEDTNFLLDYCFDFMLFRSIYTLNFFLKEDQRANISLATLADVWANVINWNATIIGSSVENTNLD